MLFADDLTFWMLIFFLHLQTLLSLARKLLDVITPSFVLTPQIYMYMYAKYNTTGANKISENATKC